MLRLEKVARRLREATVVGPGSAALGGLAPIAAVMLVVAVVTVLPWASWTATCTAGVIAAPAAAVLGCTVKTSFAAGALTVSVSGVERLPGVPAPSTVRL